MLKDAFDFSKLNIDEGWELAPGAGPGIEMKMLSGSLDEINKIGVRTRLIRFLPGSFNTEVFVHDYWEEVYMINGSITLGTTSINFEQLITECVSAPMSGDFLFKAIANVTLPKDLEIDALKEGLESLADDLVVEIRLK